MAQGDVGFEAVLQELGAGASQEVVANLRQAVLQDVEARVSEKSEELWRKGRAMLDKIQKKHDEESGRLASQVLQCNARAENLQAENAKLRGAVEELSGRLAAIGVVFGGGAPPPASLAQPRAAPAGAPASEVEASPVNTGKGLVTQPPGLESLPYVPPFPDPGAKAPILLAESLSSPRGQAPPKMPLTLSDTITPPATPCTDAGRGRFVFSFTLRKADGLSLGLNISHGEDDDSLRVESVRPDGAVEAWNRLCAGGPTAEKAVRAGDKIAGVNGISQDPKRMLEECRDRATVKLTMVRGDPPPLVTTLRAEAAAFVPMASPVVEPAVEAEPTPKAVVTPAPEATPEVDESQ